MGDTHFKLHEHDSAINAYRAAYTVSLAVDGPDSPYALKRASLLVSICFSRGDHAGGMTILQDYVARIHATGTRESLFEAAALRKMAFLMKHDGRYGEGLKLALRSEAMFEKRSGPRNTEIRACKYLQGILLGSMDRYDEALRVLEDALSIEKEAGGVKSAGYERCLYGLGQVNSWHGQTAAAETYLQKSLALSKELYGPDDENVAIDLRALARFYNSIRRFDQAEKLLRRSIDIQTAKNLPAWKIALTQSFAGDVCVGLERLDEAQRYLDMAHKVQKRDLRKGHPAYGSTMLYYGRLHLARKDYAAAGRSLNAALKIYETAYGRDNSRVAHVLRELIQVHRHTDQPDQARAAQQRIVRIQQTVARLNPKTIRG